MVYEKIEQIGQGGYAKVYSAYNKETNEKVAIKRLFINENAKHIGILGLRELDILVRSNHQYINKIIDILHKKPFKDEQLSPKRKYVDDKIYLISPLAKYSAVKLIKNATIPVLKRAMYQILSATYYLHANNFAHRDIKPSNILCYKNEYDVMDCKLSDFGLSKPMNSLNKHSLYIVTLNYKAPEILLENTNYTNKIDIWSLGCVFYEMIAKEDLFRAEDETQMIKAIFNKFGMPDNETLYKISDNGSLVITQNSKPLQSIKDIMKLDKDKLKIFNKPIVDNMYNFGNFELFLDLLDKMLQLDADNRITS